MNKKLIISLFALIVFITGGYFLLAPKDNSKDNNTDKARSTDIPSVSLVDAEGVEHNLRDFAGTPLAINSWAAWCSFCTEELKDFIEVQKEMGDKVKIIAVARSAYKDEYEEFVSSLGKTDVLFLYDSSDSFYNKIGGFTMPETIFIDNDGNKSDHKRGVLTKEEMTEKINQLTRLR